MSLNSKITNKTFPFSFEQISFFRNEIEVAGGFHALMLQKKALDHRMGMKYICIYKNIEGYRKRFLQGIYTPLQPFYETEMPFVFWSELYEVLLRTDFHS